jgi:hypothetical protein
MTRKVREEADREDGYGRCAEEVGQADAGGSCEWLIAANLKATHAVDERVKGSRGHSVAAVDKRVAGVDDRGGPCQR